MLFEVVMYMFDDTAVTTTVNNMQLAYNVAYVADMRLKIHV